MCIRQGPALEEVYKEAVMFVYDTMSLFGPYVFSDAPTPTLHSETWKEGTMLPESHAEELKLLSELPKLLELRRKLLSINDAVVDVNIGMMRELSRTIELIFQSVCITTGNFIHISWAAWGVTVRHVIDLMKGNDNEHKVRVLDKEEIHVYGMDVFFSKYVYFHYHFFDMAPIDIKVYTDDVSDLQKQRAAAALVTTFRILGLYMRGTREIGFATKYTPAIDIQKEFIDHMTAIDEAGTDRGARVAVMKSNLEDIVNEVNRVESQVLKHLQFLDVVHESDLLSKEQESDMQTNIRGLYEQAQNMKMHMKELFSNEEIGSLRSTKRART